jgi:hypothetical protein
MTITRRQWIKDCAARLVEKGQMDSDAAAAMAENCADLEKSYGTDDPATWSSPNVAADLEIASWGK